MVGATTRSRGGFVLVVVGLVGLGVTTGRAEDRTVLGELFTTIGDGGCAAAGPVVSGLIDAQPHLAVVEYHVGDAYATPWADERATFYDVWTPPGAGVPWFAYDGLANANPIETYAAKLAARMEVPAELELVVAVFPLGGNDYNLVVQACLESNAPPLSVRTYVVVAEDRYPANPNYSRNTFRMSLGTEDAELRPGACHVEFRTLTVDPAWRPENVRIIAWVQAPVAQYPAEVYQATVSRLPLPGDLNCDSRVDFGDINPFVLALSDPIEYSEQYPNCAISNGDINGDGLVNFGDINPFVALLTNP